MQKHPRTSQVPLAHTVEDEEWYCPDSTGMINPYACFASRTRSGCGSTMERSGMGVDKHYLLSSVKKCPIDTIVSKMSY